MKRIFFLPLLALIASLSILGWRKQHLPEPPLWTTGQEVPDVSNGPGVPAAMEQCRRVMTILQENNWDIPNPCPAEIMAMLNLPDGKYCESELDRNPQFTNIGTPVHDPETALFSYVYARQNRSHYHGGRSLAHPSGFVIVGYKKTGEIRQIPVSQVRCKAHYIAGQDYMCYPGQSCYDTSVPSEYTVDPNQTTPH